MYSHAHHVSDSLAITCPRIQHAIEPPCLCGTLSRRWHPVGSMLDVTSSQLQEFPYPFITVDAEKAAAKTYDYIIVGGGGAGCPLAATLSERFSVLIVERGGAPYGISIIENESTQLLARRESEYSQTFVSEDGVTGARGRVLGGSTSMNSGFYSRASLKDIQDMGWDEKLVNESYEWVEREIAFRRDLGPWQTAFKEALLEVGVLPYNGYTVDHVEGTKIGASLFDHNGKRHTAADLLKYANPDNIVVLLNATTSRVLFHPPDSSGKLLEKPRAQGVEFLDNNGASHKVFLKEDVRSEVIVSAGALGSPQLLLLSGIGPSDYLKSLKIPVILDLPGVGSGMADNPASMGATILSPLPVEGFHLRLVGIPDDSEVFTQAYSIINATQAEEEGKSQIRNEYRAGIVAKVAFPLSTGELRLHSLNPRDNPTVKFNYYSHPLDMQRSIKGVRLIAKLFESKALMQFGFTNKSTGIRKLHFIGLPPPPSEADDETMAQFCRKTLMTYYHNHGGCNIGSVINERYQVMGIDGLRVVDASTFKDTLGTNPQATVMMLARYKGVRILQERVDQRLPFIQGISRESQINNMDEL
eukprot:Gb_00812 [translate_table: standard]